MKNESKVYLLALGFIVVMLSIFVVQPVVAGVCQERTETRHQDWISEGSWGSWQNGDSSETTNIEFHHKDHSRSSWETGKGSNPYELQHRHWTDTSHWGSWGSWSTNSCTTTSIKNCESKTQHSDDNHNWYDGGCPVVSPSPSVSPSESPCISPSPSVEPSSSPSAQPSESPVVTTSGVGGGNFNPPPGEPDRTYHPAECNMADPPKPVLLQGFIRTSPTSIELSWWPTDVDHYALVFGYVGEEMNMGWPDISKDVSSFTINDLKPNTAINAQIWSFKNNCAAISNTIDP